ncbi:peptidoglycan recognition protein 1-like [Mizuhopecten yessoensis]|uniref:Peptidoglycan recognition protein 1 n=1 Tax=Mizuhopecten yessoensis TaxID=6573 RepID=A0A210QLB8_MIZYE|nr:peptidoglycan recognition protein 1-like [Mizuhopecten yessoensis]XP_021355549.1 peptidoglycan recognition protein 1-like [Mizuhopecten yessoensis]OWF49516.1 Peptidoglycan recognition protein 1 [Mizuhopecten yessoensis]
MAYKSTDIVSRAQWRARDTKGSDAMKTPVKIVFIHHTAGKHTTTRQEGSETVRGIQNFHMNERKWADVGYNFLVGEGGHVFEARGWDRVGAHTKGWNAVSVAFSIMGNFDESHPDPRALKAVLGMIQLGIEMGKISQDYKLYGHRDVGATACPGKNLYKIIQTWDHFSKEKPTK